MLKQAQAAIDRMDFVSPPFFMQSPLGIEKEGSTPESSPETSVAHRQTYACVDLKLTQVDLFDQTDIKNELVQTRHWLLHRSERRLELTGNCFVVENILDRSGDVWILQAPLRHIREATLGTRLPDLSLDYDDNAGYTLRCLAADPADLDFRWVKVPYHGGYAGRVAALQAWQREQGKGAFPKLLSNTWGDRSRDGRISEDFLTREIPAAKALGVDILQLDSGWQKGIDANSVHAQSDGGVWVGFWDRDPEFWTPHPERFPNGLEPSFRLMRAHGLEPGLWYAPDSKDAFVNWERDAACLLDLHRRYGVNHFKLDSINADGALAWQRLGSLLEKLRSESDGAVVIDLDITAGNRPGYWFGPEAGVLFLENRYTDFRNYWPHQTLRNLWQLSHWIDPRRLRIEFLNQLRNRDAYPESPLVPAAYDFATLFGITMAANPLGWFENSGLSEEQIAEAAPLVAIWKKERALMSQCTVLPFGDDPVGNAFSGFLFLEEGKVRYLLAFRQITSKPEARFDLAPLGVAAEATHLRSLWGDGRSTLSENVLLINLPKPLGFGFFKTA